MNLKNNTINVKEMETGEQARSDLDHLLNNLQKHSA